MSFKPTFKLIVVLGLTLLLSSVFPMQIRANELADLTKQLTNGDRDLKLDALKAMQRMAPKAVDAIGAMFWLIDQDDVGLTFNAMRAINANLPPDQGLEELVLTQLISSEDDVFTENAPRAINTFKTIWAGQLGLISIEQAKVESILLNYLINGDVGETEKIRALQIMDGLLAGTGPEQYLVSDQLLDALIAILTEDGPSEIQTSLTPLFISIVLYQDEQVANYVAEELTKLKGKSQFADVNRGIEQILAVIDSSNAVEVVNGNQWFDVDGQIINAHSSGVIQVDDTYYWFGEYRKDDWNFKSVRMYKSKDLKNWEFANDVLTEESHPDLVGRLIERPKIIYNDKTGKYVMWMHWENGVHYGEAKAAVAQSDTVDGDYEYLGAFRPLGHMSRDCTLFKDDDGTAYFISAANENYDLNIYRLTDDYLAIDELVQVIAGYHREAPAVLKENGYYFLVTSPCTGWSPGQANYTYTTDLESGEWSPFYNLGNNTTFESQGNYILPIEGSATTSYLYMADRHGGAYGRHPNTSDYVWFNLQLSGANTLSIDWYPKLQIDTSTGVIKKAVLPKGEGLSIIHTEGTYLSATADGTFLYMSDQSTIESDWEVVESEDWVAIKHIASGLYLTEEQGEIFLSSKLDHGANWQITEAGGDFVNISNRKTGNYLHSWPYGGDLSGKRLEDANSAFINWRL